MTARTGWGFDAHRFGGDRPLILAGVTVHPSRGVEATSDGDVVAHAVIDAVLGAAALGDIGSMFPSSDPQWKGADSLALLNDAWDRASASGLTISHLDVTVVSDTGAYAVGWRFGKHKLAPRISPGKTREGLLGAIAFAMVAGALCMQFLIDDGRWWQGLLLGLAVAASATLGDLGESMIKRDLGIKDMGTLLPGHGGIMDRLDSLLPTAPVVWLLMVLFVGSG